MFITACLGYIEISAQFNSGDVISYQWYELDANMNYVLLSGEINHILYFSPWDFKIEVDVPADLNVTSSITEPICFGDTGGIEFSVNGLGRNSRR